MSNQFSVTDQERVQRRADQTLQRAQQAAMQYQIMQGAPGSMRDISALIRTYERGIARDRWVRDYLLGRWEREGRDILAHWEEYADYLNEQGHAVSVQAFIDEIDARRLTADIVRHLRARIGG